jgi:hypothetical protein
MAFHSQYLLMNAITVSRCHHNLSGINLCINQKKKKMPGFNPDEPRDPLGKWTAGLTTATYQAATDAVDNLMSKAKESTEEVEAVAQQAASEIPGARVAPINLKSKERIIEKAQKEYGGNVNRIKDAVRTTIVVDYSKIEAAAEALKKIPGIDRVKIQDGDEYFGYKGVLANYKTKSGIDAEIQINSPGMLYAKEAIKDKMKLLTPKQYEEIKSKTGLPGGKGHEYYEQIRKHRGEVPTAELEQKIDGLIKQSKQYYSNFYGF